MAIHHHAWELASFRLKLPSFDVFSSAHFKFLKRLQGSGGDLQPISSYMWSLQELSIDQSMKFSTNTVMLACLELGDPYNLL